MRGSSSRSSTPSMVRKIWTVIAATISVAGAIKAPVHVSQPVFNLNDLGRVGLAGDFDGISLYEYTTQVQSSPFSNASHSLLTQLPNGLFTSLELADEAINAMCVYELKDGTKKGVVVGGNFTSLGGVEANGIALYDPANDKITTMKGLKGKVHALLCDKSTNRVYVGGRFTVDKSENAAAWEDGNWKNLPFEGFTGPVHTISKSNNNTILFGGNFNDLQNSTAPTMKDVQTLNIVSADITAEQTTDLSGFNDPTVVSCPNNGTGKQWLLRDGQKGSLTASFRFQFFPTRLRLVNSNFEGRSTESFRLTVFPLGGIMNLTYTDENGKEKYCSESCPLAATSAPQDFKFVNVVGMKSFRIDILSYRGAGGGLSSVQLFQDNIFTYAIPDINESACSAPAPILSGSTVSGSWTSTTISPAGDSDYLSIDVDSTTIPSTSVVFEPHIEQSGRYQVLVYTPGCIQDGSCATRGKVSISGTVTKDGKSIESSFFQTNNFDKYDLVYEGDVDAAEGAFRPRVTLAPSPATEQSTSSVRIVAQKIEFKLRSENKADGGNSTSSSSKSSKLNGIYEYDPQQTKTVDLADSRINTAGLELNENASISAIVVKGDFTYLGGNLTAKNDDFKSFFMIDKKNKNLPKVPEHGLNGVVNTMLALDSLIYVGGYFSGTRDGTTKGVAFVGGYDIAQKSWVALGAGVDGIVSEIVPIGLNLTAGFEECIAVSGKFSKVLPDSDSTNAIDANGFAVWVPSKKQWLGALKNETIVLSGILSAVVTSDNNTIYAGSVASNTMSSSGAVYLLHGNNITLSPSSLQFTSSGNAASRKRDLTAQSLTGVVTGLFYVRGGKNFTILGGNFEAKGKDSVVRNLAFIDGNNGNKVSGASSEFDSNSTILAMQRLDKLLFVGGSLKGAEVGGVAIWDLETMKLASEQPQPLGKNSTVFDISNRPDTREIYIAGDFESAGSLACANLCIYQTDLQQWNDAASEVPGTIHAMHWVNQNHMIVGGNMVLNGTATYLAVYDVQIGEFVAFDADVKGIPGPVTSIATDSQDSGSFFISGTATNGTNPFLMKFQGKKFSLLADKFEDTSKIRTVQVLNLMDNSKHDNTEFLRGENILLVTGELRLVDFGNASAVTFDGTTWKPFMLTSKASGEPGTISSFFSEYEPNFSPRRKQLAKGYVILISLAIALALVFLLVVCGVLASYIRRRREGYVPAPTMASAEKSAQMQDRLPPQDLLQDVGRGRGAPVI